MSGGAWAMVAVTALALGALLFVIWSLIRSIITQRSGERSVWARPHLRFVFSLARYNENASKQLYSPYLEFVGAERWGYYMGVKAEWWIF